MHCGQSYLQVFSPNQYDVESIASCSQFIYDPTIATLPTRISTTNQVIAQAKQPSSNLLRTLSGHGGISRDRN